jgi:hypothetical protein
LGKTADPGAMIPSGEPKSRASGKPNVLKN